ncbi:hypothetical protein TRFO_19145 [Tritrichomonas foetus]|uniref:Uncharacterized protein n=1 Tax=Tritrichomonas foetus TaxID=1144522 RepID=A0A1J4KPQ9_9EUKA|nr:hypothetical protein TRFO_19145 [Tritrichomonas foetus]|eukprot:OHT11413.1 hypothetical protein TRFO_19145 [Tritrichomonas foetus]
MDHRKPLLGLKATIVSFPADEEEEDDDFGDFFESDDEDLNTPLSFSTKTSPQKNLLPPPAPNKKHEDRIKSFDDASPKITVILSSLEDYKQSPPFKGDLYFIPEHIASDELSAALNTFARTEDPNSTFEKLSNYKAVDAHENVLAQISIVKYYKKETVDFHSFHLKTLDSRISSLIYFLLSKSDDHQVSAYYCMKSLSVYLKSPSVAPIATLFPEFTLKDIVHKLCVDLVTLFPHHPLLPSVIHKFSSIDPSVPTLLDLIGSEDSDSDSDFSSSFFDEIHVKPQPSMFGVLNLFSSTISNVLENCQSSPSNILTITVNEPPATFTYNLIDGSSQLPPNLFIDWISSLTPRYLLKTTTNGFHDDDSEKSAPKTKLGSLPIISPISQNDTDLSPDLTNTAGTSSQNINPKDLIELYKSDPNINDLILKMPNLEERPDLFHLQYPLLKIINALSVSPFTRKTPYPKVLEFEFNGNTKILQGDDKSLIGIIEEIESLLPMDDLKPIPIQRLQKKRDTPSLSTQPPENMINLIYLCIIEFLINGRSPLTLGRGTRQVSLLIQHNSQWRAGVIFSLYSHFVYPPFITFLASFALALNLNDHRPSLAADILFEGIYTLLQAIPSMSKNECVRNSLLFFAELLEKLDRYYYSSLLLDAFYLTNPNDLRSSNNIATISQRNHDIVRAAYHYSKSLESFVKRSCIDETLYVAQILAQIFADYGMNNFAVNFLSHLLKSSYKLSVGKRQSPKTTIGNGTLPPVRIRSPIREFKPPPEAVNTLLTAISLSDNLIKLRYFTLANDLLTAMKNSTDNNMFLKILDYLGARLLLKHNHFDEFMSSIKDLVIKPKHSTSGARLSLYSASNFDSALAIVRLLINSCLTRRLFAPALFWSEVYINAQSKVSTKDIGIGYLQRGSALMQARYQLHASLPPFSLHVYKFTDVMDKVASYVKDRQFTNINEITAESVSSLKSAQICLEKVGSTRLATFTSLLYADILLRHFVDVLFDKDEQAEPLIINEPQLETENKGMPVNKYVTFPTVTLDSSSVIDDLSTLFRRIDQNVQRYMNPIFIIYSQVLKAKLNYFQHKESTAKTLFDYAYSNINRYFMCGGAFIPRDLNIKAYELFNEILDNMCLLLLFFDKDYINNHLIVFDWRNDVQSLLLNTLRVVPDDNKNPIEASIDIPASCLRSMASLKFPDFFKTLECLGDLDHSHSSSSVPEDTISSCLSRINSNIHLFESQKMAEDEMHDNNRSLCRQIEVLADAYRRANEAKIPIDTAYDYVNKTVPMFRSSVFVQRIFDSIYIYAPSKGTKRKVPLTPQTKSSFVVSSKKGDTTYTSTSGILPAKLLSIIGLFLMCDKKQHHDNYNPNLTVKLCKKVKEDLFGDSIDFFMDWDKIPDDHLFGENKVFGKGLKGALCSTITSTQPAIFITSGDLRALPFELMFPKVLILRCWSYSHVILKPTEELAYPKLTVCRWKGDANHLMQNAVQRSREIIRCFVEACGGCFPMQPYVNGNDRNVCFPFPLFSSNLENQHYISKYPFCDFVDVEPNNFPNISSALFIFTYSDMCEMPLMLESLVSEYPFSFYMFIPAQFVREAFVIMSSIFERHQRRRQYVSDHLSDDPSLTAHNIILNVPFDFVTCLQATLMQQLNCPIALIAPTH